MIFMLQTFSFQSNVRRAAEPLQPDSGAERKDPDHSNRSRDAQDAHGREEAQLPGPQAEGPEHLPRFSSSATHPGFVSYRIAFQLTKMRQYMKVNYRFYSRRPSFDEPPVTTSSRLKRLGCKKGCGLNLNFELI